MTRPTPCAAIEPRLTAYLLGDLPPAEAAEVTAHLGNCPECRKGVQDLEPTLALLRSALRPELAAQPRLEKARRDAVSAARRSPPRFAWMHTARPGWLKAAALLAVCACIFAVWRHPERGRNERNDRVLAVSPAVAPAPTTAESAPVSAVSVHRGSTELEIAATDTAAVPPGDEMPSPRTHAESGQPVALRSQLTPKLPAEPTRVAAEPAAPLAMPETLVAAATVKRKADLSNDRRSLPPPGGAPAKPLAQPAAKRLTLQLGGAETAAALDAEGQVATAPATVALGFSADGGLVAKREATRATVPQPTGEKQGPPKRAATVEALPAAEPVLTELGAAAVATTAADRITMPDVTDDDLAPTSVGDSTVAALDLTYPGPAAGRHLALHTEIGESPCRPGRRLLLIGVTAGSAATQREPTATERANGDPELARVMSRAAVLPAGGLRELQVRADFSSQRVKHCRILAVTPAGSPWRASGEQAVVELGSLGAGTSATVLVDLDVAESGTGPLGIVRVWYRSDDKRAPTVGGAVLNRDREAPTWDRNTVTFRLAACAAELALAQHEPGTDALPRLEALTTKVQQLTAEAPDNPRATQLLRWLLTPTEPSRP